MLSSDLLRVALRQVYRNKRRYNGVLLGISLGLAGLVTVLTVGDSVETGLGKNLEVLGSATIIKAAWSFDRAPKWHHGQYFLKDVEGIRKLPGVSGASPAVWHYMPISHNNMKIGNGRIMGVDTSFFETLYMPLSTGRKFTDDEITRRKSVCIIGTNIIKRLFKEHEGPIGKKIFVGGQSFQVVGIMGGMEDPLFMDTILIPITVARSRFIAMYEIRDIYIRAANWDMVTKVRDSAYNLLTRNQPGYADAIQVVHYPEALKTIKNAVLLVKLFLYAAAVVTLLLGGLGITSVMLAAVRERTTEIGLRKAVGATDRMIMSQFLLESVCISLLGVAIGSLVGLVTVNVLEKIFHIVPAYKALLASLTGGILFGVALGILSGLLPAGKASKLDAADAMRFE
jgi:putative ABC transport system permease protein